jgi:hypothetical protein
VPPRFFIFLQVAVHGLTCEVVVSDSGDICIMHHSLPLPVNTAVVTAAAAAAAATTTVSTITITPGQVIITEILSARLSALSSIPIKHATKFFR